MDGLFILFVTTSFYGTAMIAAAAVIRPLAARLFARRCMVLLWCLILVRLLVPLWLPSPFPLSLSQLLSALLPDWNPPVEYTVTFSDPAQGFQHIEAVRMASATSLAALPLIWIAGALACCLLLLLSSRRTRRLVKESVRLPGGALPFPCHSPVYTSDRTKTPLTCGIFHPRILLPRGMENCGAALLRHVITHEQAHIQGGHQWIKAFALAAVCVHWFNPAVWMIPRLIARDLELCCDEQALNTLGGDNRRNYALSLLQLAQAGSCPPTCAGFGMKPVEERVRAILRFSRPSFPRQAAGTLAVCAVSLFFSTSAMLGDPDPHLSAVVKSSIHVTATGDVAIARAQTDNLVITEFSSGDAVDVEAAPEPSLFYDIQAEPSAAANAAPSLRMKVAQEQPSE